MVDKASGRPALIHFVSDFACDGNVCEARGGYREANLSSSINRYRLEYDDGRWKVTQDIMEAISQTGTNIRAADIRTRDGTVFGTIFVEVDNLPHLAKVLKAVRRVKGVTEIERREAPPN